ncbi:MAG: hypothetical protein CVU56_19555 [Deltaproteobacteria bacterium HGW-Deltaproteobacteria-14]|jgi:tetratricopeptide (TPR) repeat protein|nr:MAG: hypothetical protein CVU56_19555 [Deltaproteobacteria bacterium HGW-Deltaproteobacteria-14]
MSSSLRPRHFALGFAALCAVAVTLWLTVFKPGPEPPPDPAVAAARSAQEALARVPAQLKERPDVVTGAVRLVAERLPGDAKAIVEAVLAAVDAKHLTPRDVLADAPDAPRPAGDLAPALDGKDVGPAGGLELASLAGAIMRARGLDAPAYGVVPGTKWSATEILARRYVVRSGAGAWLALDRLPLDPAQVKPLDEVGVVANVLAWRALGAMKAGDSSLASQAANNARRLAPEDAALLFLVGKTQVNAGLADMGMASMQRAASMSADALTWFVLGRMARLQEQAFRAEEYLQKATAADPTFIPAHILRAELAIDRLEVTPKDEQPAVLAAAREQVEAAKAVDGEAPGIRIVEANLEAIAEHPDKAEALLREETELHPQSEEAWLLLAQILAVSERDRQAIGVLEDAIAHGVATAEVHKGHGALLASTGQWDDALAAFEAALAKAPADPELRPQVAQLYRANDREPEAKRLLEDQIKRFPNDVTSLLLLAQIELDAGEWDVAQLRIDKARTLAPAVPDVALLDYVAQLIAGRDATAARARTIELVGTRREVAQTLLEQGQVDEAEALLSEALTSEADDAAVPILLAGIYTGTGRDQEAEDLRVKTLGRFSEQDHAQLNQLFDAAIAQAKAQREAHQAPDAPEEALGAPAAPAEEPPAVPDAAPAGEGE